MRRTTKIGCFSHQSVTKISCLYFERFWHQNGEMGRCGKRIKNGIDLNHWSGKAQFNTKIKIYAQFKLKSNLHIRAKNGLHCLTVIPFFFAAFRPALLPFFRLELIFFFLTKHFCLSIYICLLFNLCPLLVCYTVVRVS